MLSKSKGQILRVAVTLHVLVNWESPQSIPDEISDAAMKAAINVVDVCIQHSAYLAGRGDLQDEIENLQQIQLGKLHFRRCVYCLAIEYNTYMRELYRMHELCTCMWCFKMCFMYIYILNFCLHIILHVYIANAKSADPSEKLAARNAAFSLLLPGRILYLSVLLSQTKFKSRGNKAGALAGWRLLDKSGLAKIVEVKAQRGTDKLNLCA